jgi:hypothetical protein
MKRVKVLEDGKIYVFETGKLLRQAADYLAYMSTTAGHMNNNRLK